MNYKFYHKNKNKMSPIKLKQTRVIVEKEVNLQFRASYIVAKNI